MLTSSNFFKISGALLGCGLIVVGLSRNASRVMSLVWNTALLSVVVATISVVIGMWLAFVIWRTNLRWRNLFGWSFIGLLFMPLYLQAAGWDAGFGRQGWYSYARGSLAAPLLSGWLAAVWIHTLAAVPWVLLMLRVALRSIEPELEELALLDASTWRVFWRVTLPLSRPALIATWLWIAVSTASEMTVTDMYQVRTYSEEVYTVFALGEDAGISAAEQLKMNGLVFGALVSLALLSASQLAPPRATSRGRAARDFDLGSARWPCFAVTLAVTLVAIGVPLANLIYNAGVQVEQVAGTRERNWSLTKFVQIVMATPYRYRLEFWWSSVIGISAALCAVTLATPLAWWARHADWRRAPALLVATSGIAVPGPLLGLGIIWLLNRESPAWLADFYDHSILAPVLALTIRALPPVIFVLWFSFQSISQDLLDAATLDGFRPVPRFLRMVLPQRIPALLAATIVGFAVAVGDLAASILVLPPSTPTLGFSVFQLVHAGVDDRLAGLCLVSTAGFALLASGAAWLFGKTDSIRRFKSE